MPVPQTCVGLLAVAARTAQPLTEEELLHRPAAGQVAREQRTQLPVVREPLIQEVNQSVDRRLTADPLEQISATERPETRRMIQQAAVLKTHRARRSGRRECRTWRRLARWQELSRVPASPPAEE